MSTVGSARYFQCTNSGTGVVIYPEVRDAANNVLWNGRNASNWGHWMLDIGQSVTVDLRYDANLTAGTVFKIGCDVVWGNDAWDNRLFVVSEDGQTVSGHKYGGARDGGFMYDGIKSFVAIDGARLDAHQEAHPSPLRQFLTAEIQSLEKKESVEPASTARPVAAGA